MVRLYTDVMSDQPPSVPPRPRPQGQRPSQKKQGLSHESRFIGFLVLGFGVLAVVAVAIIAFSGKKEVANKESEGVPQETAQLAEPPQELVSDMINTQAVAPQPPKPELFFKRDPDLDIGDMKGAWQATIGKYTAVVQLESDVYQVILAQPDPNAARLYSSGTYKVMEDVILFTPRLDWPEPTPAKGKSIPYEVLTRAPFPILAKIDGDKMMWQNPPQSERRVLVPYNSPLFMDENVDYVTWKKLN